MQDEDFDILLQKADPDRRLAALFATPQVRDRLLALYAFNHELGKIADASTESMIGEMKLTWWRDAVGDLYAETPKVRRHAITEGLAHLTQMIPEAEWMGLIEARFDDISARPFASLRRSSPMLMPRRSDWSGLPRGSPAPKSDPAAWRRQAGPGG